MNSLFQLARDTVQDCINRIITEERLRSLNDDIEVRSIGEKRLATITGYINVAKTSTEIIKVSSAREIEEAKTMLMPTQLTGKLVTDGLVELFLAIGSTNFNTLATDISTSIATATCDAATHVSATTLANNPWLVYAILTKYIDLNPKVKEVN